MTTPPNKTRRAQGVAAALALLLTMLFHFEGVRLRAYHDVASIVTICVGETHGVVMGQTATAEECREMTTAEALRSLWSVDSMLVEHPPPKRWAALADFEYNVGPGAARNSTAFRLINLGRIVEGCNALLRYNKIRVHGELRVSSWQNQRRAQERDMCLSTD